MSDTIAVLGLGLMGSIFARHFIDQGRPVVGFDPDPERRQDLVTSGGEAVESVGEAASQASVVVLSLPNSTVMLDVCDEIIAAGPGPDADADAGPGPAVVPGGVLVVDTTTGAPDDSITAAARLADVGLRYVDATVSGNAAQFADKDVIFMVGGEPADVELATSILDPLGRKVFALGPLGAGAQAKLVVNHVLSIDRAAVAEGLAVAEKAGLELGPMLEVLRDSAAYSKAMDIWGQRMVDGDHHPPSSWVRQSLKDSRLINAHAEAVGASHTLVEVVCLALEEAEQGGLADADNSSVMELMRRRAGIGRHE